MVHHRGRARPAPGLRGARCSRARRASASSRPSASSTSRGVAAPRRRCRARPRATTSTPVWRPASLALPFEQTGAADPRVVRHRGADGTAAAERQREPGRSRRHPQRAGLRRCRRSRWRCSPSGCCCWPAPILDWRPRRRRGANASRRRRRLAGTARRRAPGARDRAAVALVHLAARHRRGLRLDARRTLPVVAARLPVLGLPRSAASWPCCSPRCTAGAPGCDAAAPVDTCRSARALRGWRRCSPAPPPPSCCSRTRRCCATRWRSRRSISCASRCRRGTAPRIALQVGPGRGARRGVRRHRAAPARRPRPGGGLRRRWYGHAFTIGCWVLPLVVVERPHPASTPPSRCRSWRRSRRPSPSRSSRGPLRARYRHGSQAFRLILLALGLVVPAVAFYPTMFQLAWQAKSRLVESALRAGGAQPAGHRPGAAPGEPGADRSIPGLADLVGAAPARSLRRARTDRAFQIWQATALARYPVTSSVEVYGRDGTLVSRFAFNLPEDLSAAPRSDERTCSWDVAEEVSPFFAEERRVSTPAAPSASAARPAHRRARSSCTRCSTTRTCRSPRRGRRTCSCCSPATPLADAPASRATTSSTRSTAGAARRFYSSRGTAWPLDDAVFAPRRAVARSGLGAAAARNGEPFDVYLLNDRGGIYALGFPSGHRVRPPLQPRRADRHRRAHLRAAARAPSPASSRSRRAGARPAGAAARGARQLLPQAVPRLRRRGLRPGGAAGHRHAQLRRQRDAERTSKREALRTARGRQPRVVEDLIAPQRGAAGLGARRQPDGLGVAA